MLTDLYAQKKKIFGGFATTFEVGTADVTENILSPRTSTLKLRVQRLTVQVTTVSAGKTWTLGPSSGTSALTAALDVSVATTYNFDFGPVGVAFSTANAALKLTISAAGAGGRILVEGYEQ